MNMAALEIDFGTLIMGSFPMNDIRCPNEGDTDTDILCLRRDPSLLPAYKSKGCTINEPESDSHPHESSWISQLAEP